mmetsp:Transcript_7714/g.24510  ORF Transcript_7714/g.24510 Transcript_7714/m.24510 type:complete len:365 (+) Transcript_7714:64-1158(+)
MDNRPRPSTHLAVGTRRVRGRAEARGADEGGILVEEVNLIGRRRRQPHLAVRRGAAAPVPAAAARRRRRSRGARRPPGGVGERPEHVAGPGPEVGRAQHAPERVLPQAQRAVQTPAGSRLGGAVPGQVPARLARRVQTSALQLQRQDREGEDVEGVDREREVQAGAPVLHLLRSPVEHLALGLLPAAPDDGALVPGLRQLRRDGVAQVDDPDAALRAPADEHEVRRPEVAVHEAEGRHVLQGLRRLPHDRELLLVGKRRLHAGLGAPTHGAVEGPAGHELYGDVGPRARGLGLLELLPVEASCLIHPPLALEPRVGRRPSTCVVLQVPHEEGGARGAESGALRVVQPLQRPLRLPVQYEGAAGL